MTLLAALIVKNEERDLPRCLASLEPVIDGAVVVDTGSTDRTMQVAQESLAKPVYVSRYTGASQRDETGDWKLWDFAKARNVSVAEAEQHGASRIFWVDADETLVNPDDLAKALDAPHDILSLGIRNKGFIHSNHRIWRAGLGIKFRGRIHEFIVGGDARTCLICDHVILEHHSEEHGGETSNDRNLRILKDEWKLRPDHRTAYYFGQEYRIRGDYHNAIRWFDKRIKMGALERSRDEFLFAHLHKSRCQQGLNDLDGACKTLFQAIAVERGWAEFWCELACIEILRGNYSQAMGFALQCDVPVPPTAMAREHAAYGEIPNKIIEECAKAAARMKADAESGKGAPCSAST